MADDFAVSVGSHLLSGFVHATPRLWRWLAGIESNGLREQIDAVVVDRPVWVTGLARSGSTILLEILASHPAVATHQYRDFPLNAIPYWWRSASDKTIGDGGERRERAHGDRLQVSLTSPEAMEEPLWMLHCSSLHDAGRSQVLSATDLPQMGSFLDAHIRKLLLVTQKQRYVSKANYNITRMSMLRAHFPDARFVVPIRDPRTHIASLAKQHRLFCDAARRYPRSVSHLNRVGHFEFGANRTPIHVGDDTAIAAVRDAWSASDEIRGWALYWAQLYDFVHACLCDEALAQSVLLVRYEDLCDDPRATLSALFGHVGLGDVEASIEEWAGKLSAPTYYEPSFAPNELAAIEQACGDVAGRFGYDLS